MAFDVSSIFSEELKKVSKSDTGRELREVDVDDLVGNEANFYTVDEAALEELKNSIALSGIMDPPTVTEAGDGKYRLISGHRRTAAVRALVAEGREDLRKVPVFVRSPRSAAMEELELIMANSTARRLSSAEISEAAQRVERLLYELKEQGVEFPGRMRDHVAEACNVSRTKLANLKTIEEHLIADFKPMWKSGKLPDATALELARCELTFQTRLYDAFARAKELPTSAGVEKLREFAEKGAKWNPSASLRCPDGSACPGSRDAAVLRHDALCPSWGGQCRGEKCCMDCPFGANASSWGACKQMCSKAAQYRADKSADAKAAEAEAQETKQHWRRMKIQHDAQRIVRAADAARCPNSAVLNFGTGSCPTNLAMIRRYAEGNFGDERFWCDNRLVPDGAKVPAICDTLRCSADYLLGMTDELTPVSKSDTLPWRTGTDYTDGKILFLFDDAGRLSYQVSEARFGRIRIYSDYSDGKIVRWLPLPPEEEGCNAETEI